MRVPGLPFLVSKPRLCDVFGVERHTLLNRIRAGVYDKLEWVKDGPTWKVTRPSLEDQLDSMVVDKKQGPTLSEVGL